jgi:hypothetical protein
MVTTFSPHCQALTGRGETQNPPTRETSRYEHLVALQRICNYSYALALLLIVERC